MARDTTSGRLLRQPDKQQPENRGQAPYEKTIGKNTTLVIDPDSDLYRYLGNLPK